MNKPETTDKKIIIVAGPSAVGKSTFVDKITSENSQLVDIITYTTRDKREGESEGQPYYFVTLDKFKELEGQGFFVETARVHNNFYGTPYDQMEQAWAKGKAVIMDIDVQGAHVFKEKFPWTKTIFILPPHMDALRQRLIKRDGSCCEDLDVRMQTAQQELTQVEHFDFQLVNEEFDSSYAQFKKIVEEILKA